MRGKKLQKGHSVLAEIAAGKCAHEMADVSECFLGYDLSRGHVAPCKVADEGFIREVPP